jgi:hypothetical protein
VLTPGQAGDAPAAQELLGELDKGSIRIADRAYERCDPRPRGRMRRVGERAAEHHSQAGFRLRLDNTVRGLCVAFGIKMGPGQGKDLVAKSEAGISVPGLREAAHRCLTCANGWFGRSKRFTGCWSRSAAD